jgi:hypothetical protein
MKQRKLSESASLLFPGGGGPGTLCGSVWLPITVPANQDKWGFAMHDNRSPWHTGVSHLCHSAKHGKYTVSVALGAALVFLP